MKKKTTVYGEVLEESKMKTMKILALIMLPVMILAITGCSDDDDSNIMAPSKQPQTMDIVETAISAGNFSTLVTALQAAELVDALRGEGPFTVFAPTDDAFAALPEGLLNDLLNDKEALTSVLTYHVIAGNVKAEDVVKESSFPTLNGQSFEVKVMDGNVMIDNATVITTDIICSNGVIHVIDAVIVPEL